MIVCGNDNTIDTLTQTTRSVYSLPAPVFSANLPFNTLFAGTLRPSSLQRNLTTTDTRTFARHLHLRLVIYPIYKCRNAFASNSSNSNRRRVTKRSDSIRFSRMQLANRNDERPFTRARRVTTTASRPLDRSIEILRLWSESKSKRKNQRKREMRKTNDREREVDLALVRRESFYARLPLLAENPLTLCFFCFFSFPRGA